jgi:diguanylate cyclase (GGDEF) domain
MFHDRLEQEMKKAHRNNSQLALMFLDLDEFKAVNDTLGHDIGDVLLKEATQRLRDCVRETDTVARLGGDEFTVILTNLDEYHQNVEPIANIILLKLAEPFSLCDKLVHVSASIGITFYPDDATTFEELLKTPTKRCMRLKIKAVTVSLFHAGHAGSSPKAHEDRQ